MTHKQIQHTQAVLLDSSVESSDCVRWYYLGLFVFLMVIGLGMTYALWQWALLVVAAIAIWFGVRALYPRRLQAIVIDQALQVQCLVATHLGDELWQGRLISCQRLSCYVVLTIDVSEPSTRTVRFCIFYDQVAPDDFRKMCVLARFLPS